MSGRFKFVLQPVLEHRERIEDEKQQALAVKQLEFDAAQRELDRLDAEFRTTSARMRKDHQRLNFEELRLHYAHLQFLDRAIDAQSRVVAERRVALDASRADLLAASKNRKVVEKLKERRKALHTSEEMRRDQNEMDDGNSRRFGRTLGQVGGSP